MAKQKKTGSQLPSLVIITGLSGSGMSAATDTFEDLGYFCVDNLPLTLVPTFARLLRPSGKTEPAIERAALVIDIREPNFLTDFESELDRLKKGKLEPFVVFFEASDEVLQRRFSQTRRPHPADDGEGLSGAIKKEREALRRIRELADVIVDTSEHTVHSLRHMLVQQFGGSDQGVPLKVQVYSFGHKYGSPPGLDLVFDVRHLPNPYFEESLKHLCGEDPEIVSYLDREPEVEETTHRFTDLLLYLLPKYKREGKSYLSVGIGCTGGRHRSVMVANKIGDSLRQAGFEVSIAHRDMHK